MLIRRRTPLPIYPHMHTNTHFWPGLLGCVFVSVHLRLMTTVRLPSSAYWPRIAHKRISLRACIRCGRTVPVWIGKTSSLLLDGEPASDLALRWGGTSALDLRVK